MRMMSFKPETICNYNQTSLASKLMALRERMESCLSEFSPHPMGAHRLSPPAHLSTVSATRRAREPGSRRGMVVCASIKANIPGTTAGCSQSEPALPKRTAYEPRAVGLSLCAGAKVKSLTANVGYSFWNCEAVLASTPCPTASKQQRGKYRHVAITMTKLCSN